MMRICFLVAPAPHPHVTHGCSRRVLQATGGLGKQLEVALGHDWWDEGRALLRIHASLRLLLRGSRYQRLPGRGEMYCLESLAIT